MLVCVWGGGFPALAGGLLALHILETVGWLGMVSPVQLVREREREIFSSLHSECLPFLPTTPPPVCVCVCVHVWDQPWRHPNVLDGIVIFLLSTKNLFCIPFSQG